MSKGSTNLGRSISDLLEENKAEFHKNEEVLEILIESISPNPDQPRTHFDKQSLNELAASIKEHGVISPIILKPTGNNTFMLVAGERRVKASKIAGLRTVPSIVRNYNSLHLSEIAILENIQREDLSPIEEAIAFQSALAKLNLTHEQLSHKIGKSRSYVTNSIGLLNLPVEIIEHVNLGMLSMGHARVLSKVKNRELCMKLFKRILDEELTVRELELIVREISRKREAYIISSSEMDKLQGQLRTTLPTGTKCRVRKNKIEFAFESKDELDRVMGIILGGNNE